MDDKQKTSDPLSGEQTASLLQQIATSTSGCIAAHYFKELVSSLSSTLSMDATFVGELTHDTPPIIQTKAAIINGVPIDDLQYKLALTPCEKALKQRSVCYVENVQQAFPDDRWLQEMDIHSYFGAPLISSLGDAMGTLVVCSQSPITNIETVRACFDMVVARTAAEMERMRTEHHLRELLQVVEQSPVVIAKADLNSRLVYVNRHFETTTGYSKEEVLGKDPRFLTEGTASETVYKDLWDTIKKGNTWRGELLNNRKDGSQFWAKATFSALKNAEGDITGYISLKEEITELKEQEKHLRLAASVFETASEALVITDTEQRIKKVNQAFTNITGYSRDEAIGQNPSMLQSGRHEQSFYQAMFNSLATKDVWEGEVWNRRKNGEIYPEWLRISTIIDGQGNLEGYVGLFSDITQRKQSESLIRHQTNFDALTGLPNRSLFRDRLSNAIDLAKKNQNHIAVLFIDIDRFKNVNDTLGHTIGDQLLQDIAKRLTFNLKKPNTVARFGGDEFIVILPDEDNLHRLENCVLSILKHLETPYNLNGHKVFASASIGVSVYPYDGDDTETLLRKADNAMHKAKEKGRNNVQFFTMEMDIEAQRRQELEQDLHKAIAKKQLSLNYQPIIDAQTGMIVSAEALVRWKHPKKGFISPVDFIPLAEEVGIITTIGEWVLREACETASHWTAEAGSIPSVSVNLSSIQFQKQDIPTLVKKVLLETGLPARRLTLEITESLLVNDDHNTLKQLQEIRSLGVGLSIDDFGTGYSSLSYLKKFPVSTLKIDRSFITGLPKNTEDKALVSAILGIARSLSLSVVAEGVETQEQADLLTKEGCQRFQGYLFSKPLPRLEFETLLQRQDKKINVL